MLSLISEKGSILAVKVILVLFALGLCVVSNRSTLWPLVTWPMFHARTPEVPPPRVTVTHVRVTDREGDKHILGPTELMPDPRDAAANELIEMAFSPGPKREPAREHIVFLAERALDGVEVRVVEALDRTWKVDPYATPPLDRSDPLREAVSDRYPADGGRLLGGAP